MMGKLALAALVMACIGCDSPFGMEPPHPGYPCVDATDCDLSTNACEPNVCAIGYCDGTVVIGQGVLVRSNAGTLRECRDGREEGTDQTPDCADCEGPYAPCGDHGECLSGNCSISYSACGGTKCCAETEDGHNESD